jgi:tRNA A-37 threonylcarbamoyl transferase component Bud32
MVGLLSPGVVFGGDYRVQRLLAQGGMGAVYAAEQISTGKARALKLMHPQLVANPELRRRFEQEARVGSRIDSDHVVEVQAAGVDAESGVPYLVMELLDGEDLAAHVRRRGPLSAAETSALVEQLAHALAAAHAAGVVHRDLKPENVFLARARQAGASVLVKVLDFGIAKLAAEAGSGATTAAMGSPQWMAPEQTERGPIGPMADVWAMGLLAYFLLAGRPYWRTAQDPGATVTQLLREILFEPLEAPSARVARGGGPSLPAGFDAWFERAVARDPAQRFADARAAWSALAPVLRGTSASGELATAATLHALPPLPSAAPPTGAPAPTPPAIVVTPAPSARGRVMAWALGGGLVSVTGAFALAAAFVFFRTNRETPSADQAREEPPSVAAATAAPSAATQSRETVAVAQADPPPPPVEAPRTVAPQQVAGGSKLADRTGAPGGNVPPPTPRDVGGASVPPKAAPPSATATEYTPQEIRSVVKAAQPRLDKCYVAGASTTAAATAQVGPDGKITTLSLAAPPATKPCIDSVLRTMRFTPFAGPPRGVQLTVALHPPGAAAAE